MPSGYTHQKENKNKLHISRKWDTSKHINYKKKKERERTKKKVERMNHFHLGRLPSAAKRRAAVRVFFVLQWFDF